jgi:putative flavoprotein involved in K+ transport
MTEYIETAIIGGGQAGLALSYYLVQQGMPHFVFEQGRIGESWRSQRWDSFRLVTPNWTIQLPGYTYHGSDPDGFLPRSAIISYLERYAQSFNAPVLDGVCILNVRQRADDGYEIRTNDRTYVATNVVLATGAYQKPKLPQGSTRVPADVYQIHSSQYRNSEALPPGAVLVVGTGQSGFQIAEELHENGRKVYLSTSSCSKTPMRYRGKDVVWWLTRMGFFNRRVDQLPSPMAKFACSPHVSNRHSDRDVTLRQFAAHGMTLLGHLQEIEGSQVILAPDLQANLLKAEAFTAQVKQMIDGYIAKAGIEAPAQTDSEETEPSGPTDTTTHLDLHNAGIKTIIWATGYRPDFSWVDIPVFDQMGYPLQQRGVTAFSGLYFLGLPWLSTMKSALLSGIGEDAAFIASTISEKN